LESAEKRKVIRVGIVYLVVGRVLMQIDETTFEALALPAWLHFLTVIIICG
jgi:hypothetical protein